MIDKVVASPEEGVAGLSDGMTVLVGGFNDTGSPYPLLRAGLATGAKDLTVVHNGAGIGEDGLGAWLKQGRVRHIICSFPTTPRNDALREKVGEGFTRLEVCPQGTIAERLRAGGSGLGGVLTPTGVGTELAEGKPIYELDGRQYVVERPIKGDFALIRGWRADRLGNVQYHWAQRNFNHVMAMAARMTVVQVEEIVEPGEISPMDVHTPGIFVQRVVMAHQELTQWQ